MLEVGDEVVSILKSHLGDRFERMEVENSFFEDEKPDRMLMNASLNVLNRLRKCDCK